MFVCVLESWAVGGRFDRAGAKRVRFQVLGGAGGGGGLLRDLDRFASEQNGQPLVMTSG